MSNRINYDKIREIQDLEEAGFFSVEESTILQFLLKGMNPSEIIGIPPFTKEMIINILEKIDRKDADGNKILNITREDILGGNTQRWLGEIRTDWKRIGKNLQIYIDTSIKRIKQSNLQGNHKGFKEQLQKLLFKLRSLDENLKDRISELETMLQEEQEKERRRTLKICPKMY